MGDLTRKRPEFESGADVDEAAKLKKVEPCRQNKSLVRFSEDCIDRGFTSSEDTSAFSATLF